MSKYVGLTIGPIVDTLVKAKSTRQLWGSSYIFSFIMKNIIKELIEDREFIVPNTSQKKLFNDTNTSGLFSDRFIYLLDSSIEEDLEKERLNKIIDNVLKDLAKRLSNVRGQTFGVYEYLKEYIKIYYVIAEVKENNPVIKINKMLDSIELIGQYRYQENKEDDNFLMRVLDIKETKKESLNNKRIEEVIFGVKENFIKSIDTIAGFNKNDKHTRRAKKYFAIVQADGDNVGKLIKTIYSPDLEKIHEFSRSLFNFARKSVDIIKKHGGLSIYVGGDDLLFFAPVISKNGNIFDLLDEISLRFDEEFEKFGKYLNEDEPRPSLSLGVSISYHKYPLYEALNNAIMLLFDKAKKSIFVTNKEKIAKKNAIAFDVIKHSGQKFGCIFNKESEEYEVFRNFIKDISTEDKEVLKSVHHSIMKDEQLFKCFMKQDIDISFDSYFENKFNEPVHNQQKVKKQLEDIKELMKLYYNKAFIQNKNENEEKKKIDQGKINENTFRKIDSILRFVKFLSEEGEN